MSNYEQHRVETTNKIKIPESLFEFNSPNFVKIMSEHGDADKFAKNLRKLKSTQLRKFFDEIKSIEKELKTKKDADEALNKLLLLVPKIKYSKARDLVPEEFSEFVSKSVKRIVNSSDKEKEKMIINFVKIFEAIIAYHKYHYPKS
ncbi:type III-A CRISPR-associated protein Csm2 [candidate division Kazan bacterium]|uniref:CRISPR system Cms protein Csm2 n=1 Tax=candidate division Kazan bacterium TaxID=2202143 RepID=A0A420ZCP0_UNCK3|nr:MAG: type III-A CRISPR-associated protein Csm2 [candidate division Kazan bacterium]